MDATNGTLSKYLKNMYLMLYLQFAFYLGTIAMGMVVNYYYAVPGTLQPTGLAIFGAIATSWLLLPHVVFAVLSTGMSVPIIIVARRVKLNQVVPLHVAAILVRMGGFIGGPLFLYFSTSAISQGTNANISSLVMASVFMTAVALTFLSRIFVVREDVRIMYVSVTPIKAAESEPPKKEQIGNLGLSGLRVVLDFCYANFIVYLLLYFSGMYINIWITSGVSTVSIGNAINIFHVVVAALSFSFSFFIMGISFIYGMKKAAIFSLGAVISIVIGAFGGLVFLATGGARVSGSLTLAGGWIMSLVFMLAFFFSYYSTIRVMRAIRVSQAFKGDQNDPKP